MDEKGDNEKEDNSGEEEEENDINMIEPERDDAVLVFDKHKGSDFHSYKLYHQFKKLSLRKR